MGDNRTAVPAIDGPHEYIAPPDDDKTCEQRIGVLTRKELNGGLAIAALDDRIVRGGAAIRLIGIVTHKANRFAQEIDGARIVTRPHDDRGAIFGDIQRILDAAYGVLRCPQHLRIQYIGIRPSVVNVEYLLSGPRRLRNSSQTLREGSVHLVKIDCDTGADGTRE